MMETTNLDKYLSTLKRIEEHREDSAVKDLKKLYKRLLKDLRAQLGDMYANYADEKWAVNLCSAAQERLRC